MNVDIKEYSCVLCGQIFIPAPEHIYKDHRGKYCSWRCFNHRNDHKKKAYNAKTVDQFDLDGNFVNRYPSTRKAADAIDGCQDRISVACRTGRIYKGCYWEYVKEVE